MRLFIRRFCLLLPLALWLAGETAAQPSVIAVDTGREIHINHRLTQGPVRPVTIPITIRWRDKNNQSELLDLSRLQVLEDNEAQEVVSIRAVGTSDPQGAVLAATTHAGAVVRGRGRCWNSGRRRLESWLR